MNKFLFRGNNRHIIILPRSAPAPVGFKLGGSSQADAQLLVREISPHLAQNFHALSHACSLLQTIGISVAPNARAVTPKLSESLSRGLLSLYVEQEKPALHAGEESNTDSPQTSASGAKEKVLPKSQGKQDENSVQTGTSTNHTTTEVPIAQQECRSDPISMLTGEEILPLVDFELSGVLPLSWRRLYRSSKTAVNLGLGYGWRHNFSLQLVEKYIPPPKVGPKKPGRHLFELIDEEGRLHLFEQVKRGQTSVQLSSGLSLYYQEDGKQVLIKPDDSHWTFVKAPALNGQDSGCWLLESISNYHGQYHALYYDKQHRLVRIACSPKRGIVLHYNQDNNLLRIAAYVMDDKGKQELQPGFMASYHYDDNQALIAATDSRGLVERYQYIDHCLLKRRTRASGFSHHFQWQGQGPEAKCIRQWGDDDTYQYRFAYRDHPKGQLTTCTDSLGNVEQFVHNRQGLLVAHTALTGFTTEFDYDGAGRKVRQTDASGNATYYRYNEQGQLSEVTAADGGKTRYYYNTLGKRILTLDALGQQHKRQFDGTGRLLSQTGPDGRSISYSYTDQGQLKQIIAADGVVSLYHWSDSGELLALQQGDKLTRYSYDPLGRINASIDAQGLIIEYIRDAKGQLVELLSYDQAKPDNKISQKFSYDQAGRFIKEQISDGVETTDAESAGAFDTLYHYQGLAQPEQKTFADGSYLKYHYDQERNLTGITRSDGARYEIDYSPSEKPIKLTGFDGREQQYQYDKNDKLIAINDSDERFIRLKRDNMGRITEQICAVVDKKAGTNVEKSAGQNTIPGPGVGVSSQCHSHNFYQYDLLGRLRRAHNSQRTVQLSYHYQGPGTGQLKQVQQGNWSLDYGYNNKGQRASLKLPDGSVLLYEYDRNGQLKQLDYLSADGQEKAQNQTQPLIQCQYNKSGLLTGQMLGNGIVLSQAFDVYSRLSVQQWQAPGEDSSEQGFDEICRYQYDNRHQLIHSEQSVPGTEGATDAGSQVASKNAAGKTQEKSFCYNRISQLISTTEDQQHSQHHWDAFGNPAAAPDASTHSQSQNNDRQPPPQSQTAKTMAALETDINVYQDRLLSFAGTDYGYDPCGNQISSLAKGEKQQRFFDGLNQLQRINVNGNLTHYEYDALRRRTAKTTEQGRTDFIWDNNQLIGEHHKGKFTWYIYHPGSFLPLALIKAGQIYYYHLDLLGTPICLTDKSAKAVWRNNTDVFGAALTDGQQAGHVNENTGEQKNSCSCGNFTGTTNSENSITNPLRFQGQYYDSESGLHYNRFRYYCPRQGRFIHQDPIGLAGGINPYQYAPNPVNWIDPFGLLCDDGKERVAKALALSVIKGEITQALSDQIFSNAILPDCTDSADEIIACIPVNGQTIAERFAERGSELANIDEKTFYYNTQTHSYNKINKKDKPKVEVEAKTTNKKDVEVTKNNELKKLVADREEAFNKREELDPTDKAAFNAATQEIRKISEKIGMKSARLVMKDEYPEFKWIECELPGDGKQGQFDLLYHNPKTGEIITVEAKGGGGGLGNRKGLDGRQVEQGSPEYRDSIIENMEKKIITAQNDEKYGEDDCFTTEIDALIATYDKLLDAQEMIGSEDIIPMKSVCVRQRLNKDGSLMTHAELSTFSNTYTDPKHDSKTL
ncbi:RHS repeat-associated core domain-containing protein [Thalassomonas sp. RHCl1]|uniref:RHS repeat-associated core domain-containing protein n=1 Tax=Thalassomonas sp. RHCl1 TaxID=2995320 RepID=UPI00248ABF2B|nr:RHS repeat-associated core domain-containing protein [Thalassomonas sp. RHCl1]